MRKTTPIMFSGFALIAFSIYILYAVGISWNSLSFAVTLDWIGSFLILISWIARRISKSMSPKP